MQVRRRNTERQNETPIGPQHTENHAPTPQQLAMIEHRKNSGLALRHGGMNGLAFSVDP